MRLKRYITEKYELSAPPRWASDANPPLSDESRVIYSNPTQQEIKTLDWKMNGSKVRWFACAENKKVFVWDVLLEMHETVMNHLKSKGLISRNSDIPYPGDYQGWIISGFTGGYAEINGSKLEVYRTYPPPLRYKVDYDFIDKYMDNYIECAKEAERRYKQYYDD